MRENNRKPNCVFPRLAEQRRLCAQFPVHKFCIKGVELPEIIKGFFVGIEPKRQTPLANLVGFGKLIFPSGNCGFVKRDIFFRGGNSLGSASAIEKSSEKSAAYKTAFVLSILSIMSFCTIQSSETHGLGTL